MRRKKLSSWFSMYHKWINLHFQNSVWGKLYHRFYLLENGWYCSGVCRNFGKKGRIVAILHAKKSRNEKPQIFTHEKTFRNLARGNRADTWRKNSRENFFPSSFRERVKRFSRPSVKQDQALRSGLRKTGRLYESICIATRTRAIGIRVAAPRRYCFFSVPYRVRVSSISE